MHTFKHRCFALNFCNFDFIQRIQVLHESRNCVSLLIRNRPSRQKGSKYVSKLHEEEKQKKWGCFTLIMPHLEMVIGYSSAVKTSNSFVYLLWEKCFGQLKINFFNIKKLFYCGALLVRSKEGNMMVVPILHLISLITLTGRDSRSTFPLRRWE